MSSMFICFILIWISTASAFEGGETPSDDRLATSPFLRQLVERVRLLEARDQNQQKQIDTQKQDILILRRSVASKDRSILKLLTFSRKQDTKVKTTTGDSGNASRQRRIETEGAVAFFTGLTRGIQHAGENQNIVFDKVETNLGNGYNSNQGIFTAPVAGTYLFTTSIMTRSGRKICEMVVNGAQKAQVYTHGDGHYDHGTQTIIVQLKPGDDVAVQIVEHNFDNTIHGKGIPYTTFSGFLLQQDYSDSGTVVG